MRAVDVIRKKRDGGTLDRAEVEFFVAGVTGGSLPDYQAAALLMAILLRGMSTEETAVLTDAMVRSGVRMQYPGIPAVPVDKHSTGGVGDKTSLILAPLAAACGAYVPMMSGRGLGHTGGTLDKLEAIPGLRTRLSLDELRGALAAVGCALIGQTEDIAPADRKLYSLRDVTGTVPSIALITASIMSKKLAETLDRLVLDVKFGSGAFMQTKHDAEALAANMIAVGQEMGVEVHAVLNPMSEPLGRAVGNSLEVIESLECLEGGGPADLRSIVLDLAEKIAGVSRGELERLLDDGSARRKFDELVAAQGGNPADLPRLGEIHKAPIIREVIASAGGVIFKVDAGLVGQAALQLGAGRSKATDGVDFAVGFDRLVKCGEPIHAGQAVCRIHARTAVDFDMAEAMIEKAVGIEAT